jgi:ABC-2 type transport system permease protein
MSTTAVDISAARRLYWSVRRELWENRSIYLGPLTVGAVVLIGFCVALFNLPGRMRAASVLGERELRAVVEQPFLIAALMLMAVEMLVAVFYSLDALYGERRDRSVLFWKSLPVSDLTTVFAKASIPILLLPLITWFVTVATQFVMLLASSAVLAASGMSAATVWTHVPILETSWINFAHLVTYHGIWYAPLYAWLLLVSAWATRAPFLWAVLPPVALGIFERIAFGTRHFASLVQTHFLGDEIPSDHASGMMSMTMDMLAPPTLGHFLASPGLWVGLLLAAMFLLGAVRLRRVRGPM